MLTTMKVLKAGAFIQSEWPRIQDSFVNLCFSANILNSIIQRQYKVRVSGKMQLLQKKIEDNSPAQNRLTGQKQLLKRK